MRKVRPPAHQAAVSAGLAGRFNIWNGACPINQLRGLPHANKVGAMSRSLVRAGACGGSFRLRKHRRVQTTGARSG
jgi:hypothetical protein